MSIYTRKEAFLKREEFDRYTHLVTFEPLKLDDSQKMGYIYKCLRSGITALRRAMQDPTTTRNGIFKAIMTELVLTGGDADTNGSVAGALLGAWVGTNQLPPGWIENMTDHAWLVDKTTRLVAAVGIRDAEGEAAGKAISHDTDTDIYGGRQPLTKAERDERERNMVFVVISKSKMRADEERQKLA
jgi:ADP-ribosylglycohydrolase